MNTQPTPGWYQKLNQPATERPADFDEFTRRAQELYSEVPTPQQRDAAYAQMVATGIYPDPLTLSPRTRQLTPRHWLILGGTAAALLVVAALTMDGGTFVGLILWALLGALWLSPGIIASKRGHRNAGGIWVVTLLLGWTIIGWVVALAMALSDPGR